MPIGSQLAILALRLGGRAPTCSCKEETQKMGHITDFHEKERQKFAAISLLGH